MCVCDDDDLKSYILEQSLNLNYYTVILQSSGINSKM